MDMPAALDRWNARLSLAFGRRGSRTAMIRNQHFGPLVVQRALHPEGDAVCQAIVLHPPGGIAGGDHLEIDIDCENDAVAQLTTPGATKWYKANGRAASQRVHIAVADGAIVEWLPLESIVFDGAVASSSLVVDIAATGSAAGWDIAAFGRSAAGERFDRGHYRQSIEVRRDGRLSWAENGAVRGTDPLFASPVGFDGRSVCGVLWVASALPIGDDIIDACRDVASTAPSPALHGVTSLPGNVVVVRCVDDSSERIRSCLSRVWGVLRPCYAGRAAIVPRLWMT